MREQTTLAAAMTAGLALMAAAGPAWAQSSDDKLVATLGLPEVRALAVETGGVPGEVEHLADNEYRMEIAYPDGLYLQFEGWNCIGDGEAKRCAEFLMYVWFELGSEAEALAKEHEVNIAWLSDSAFGTELKVWRMDYLAGMTRGRLRGLFDTFVHTANLARDVVFPVKTAGGSGK